MATDACADRSAGPTLWIKRKPHRHRHKRQLEIVMINCSRSETIMSGVDKNTEHETGQGPCPAADLARAHIETAEHDEYTERWPCRISPDKRRFGGQEQVKQAEKREDGKIDQSRPMHRRAAVWTHPVLMEIEPVLAVQQILDLDQPHHVVAIRPDRSKRSLEGGRCDQPDRHDHKQHSDFGVEPSLHDLPFPLCRQPSLPLPKGKLNQWGCRKP